MRKSNRVLAALLSILMIISMLPVFAGAAAYGFSDFPTGTWSEEAVTAAVNNGLLQGKGGGIIAPRDNLTRAEAAAVINRAFGATVKADISEYTDVNPGDWYYSEFQKAVNMGTIVGEGEGILNPNGYITREAMFTMVARALVLSDTTAGSLSRFVDGSDTSVWAASYVSAMAKRGYVNGDNDGRLNPQAYITREEFAQVMHNIFKMYISTSGTVSDAVYGTTIIRVPNVDLKNITINGDLILGDGVGAGDVYMTNVKVTGRILCRGGEGTVDILSGCSVGEMVVIHDVNGVVNFHNYSNEKIFEGIVLNTEATFLGNVSFNTGSSSSSSKKNASYTIYIYEEDVDKEGEYKLLAPTKSETAKKGIKITYTPDDKYGFIVDEAKSVLSGTNNGSLEIKVYYKRLKYNVTIDGVLGVPYEYRYGQTIDKNEDLAKIIMEKKIPAVEPGYEIEGYYTEENGKGTKVDSSYVVLGPVTIYPNIVPEMFDVIYKANGGKIKVNKELLDEVTEENKVTVTGTYDLTDYEVEYAGHTFMGWYMEGKPNEIITTIPTGMTDDVTVYAKWIENAIFTFDVVEPVGDEEIEVNVVLDKIPGDIADIGIKNMIIKLSYSYTDGKINGLFKYDSVSSNIGGTVAGDVDAGDEKNITLTWTGDALKALPAGGILFTLTFKKDKFTEAEVNFNFGDITVKNGDEKSTAFVKDGPCSVKLPEGLTKITVKYNEVYYTVYPGDILVNAKDSEGNSLSEALAKFNPETDVPKGWENWGFVISGTKVTDSTAATQDMDDKEIVPNNTAIPYTVIYDLNGGTVDGQTSYSEGFTVEAAHPLLRDTNRLKKDGYVFIDWYKEEEPFENVITEIKDTIPANNKSITVYAKWEKKAELSLDYKPETIDATTDTITVQVKLSNLPTDIGIDDLSAITIDYIVENNYGILSFDSVEYAIKGINNEQLGNVNGSMRADATTEGRQYGAISWYADEPTERLTTIPGDEVIFIITFKRDLTKGGTVKISFDKTGRIELANHVPTIALEYTVADGIEIDIPVKGDDSLIVTFNGTSYYIDKEGKLGDALSNKEDPTTTLAAAMDTALENAGDPDTGYKWVFNVKNASNAVTKEVNKDFVVKENITLTLEQEPIPYDIIYHLGEATIVVDGTSYTGDEYTEEYTIVDTLDADNPRMLYTGDVTQDGHTFMGWLDEDDKLITALALGQTDDVEVWADMVKYPVLSFEKIESDISTEIKVAVTLEDIPHDLKSITSVDLSYVKDIDDKLAYVGTEIYKTDKYDGIGGTIIEEVDGTIKWTADTSLSDIGDEKLFVITYTKALTEEGKVKFSYDEANTTITGLDAQGATVVADKYTVAYKEISLTKSDIHTIYVYKGVGEEDDGNESVGKIIVEHKKPESDEDSEHALCKIKQEDLNEIIDPETYVAVQGYTDSDGNAHEIDPEYWYNDGDKWKLFDVDMEIVSDMNVHLLTRYAMVTYQTDLEFKGIEIPSLEIKVAYDSETDIGESVMDALKAARNPIARVLQELKKQEVDVIAISLEKAAKTGLVDSDGNLLNPLVAIPLDKIVTEDLIMKEIDIYIDANIDNEEFIRDILRHDSVEKMLLEDEAIKHNAMGDPEIRSIFLTDEFIREIIKDDIENNNSAFVNDIINNTDFASTVINNDSVLDYVLNNEEIRAKVLESGTTFKLKIVDTGAQHIENVYFGDTVDAELKSYIETELKSDAVKGDLKVIIENSNEIRAVLKTTLETDEDAKAILKTELLEMLQNPQTNSEIKTEVENYLIANKNVVKDEVTSYIKDNKNSTSIKNTVVQYIKDHKNDKLIKDAVVDYITTNKNNTTIKNTIVSYIKDHKNDDLIKGTVKAYLEEHMNDATVRGTVVDYIEKHSEEDTIKDRVIDYIVSNVDDFKADDKRTDILSNQTVRTQFVNAYESVTIGTVWEDVDADTFIDKFINAPSELKAIDESTYNNIVAEYKKAIEDNIEEYATSNYTTLFSDYFNETYLNSKADSESEKTVYEKLFEDNLNAIMNDTATYETLFDANIDKITGDKDKYEELFSNNVTSIVNDKVKDPQTNKTVYETLFDDNVDAIISDNTKDSETDKTPYETLFDDNVDTIINDNTKDSETGKTAYETLFDDNFSTYYNSLDTDEFNNLVNTHYDSFYTSQYDSLFDEYFDEYFDEIFESLYKANVEKWANIAYDEPTTKETVRSTIKKVVTRLIDEYIAGAKDADDDVEVESGLKSMVDKVIKQIDLKATLRENYNNDGDFKTAVDQLIKDNASMIVGDYAYEKLDDASETAIRDIIHTQVEKLVDDYVNYNMDKDLQEFIDVEINKHMKEYIDGYIAGDPESVEMLQKLVPTYAHTAVEALKETSEFKNTISDFVSGNGVRVNEGNIVFIEILDELMHTYNYDKLASDFLPENIQKVVDLIGHDIVADIVNAYFAEFCRLMDDAIAKFNADYDAGITDAEYTFSTRPAVRINYMDIVETYYNKVMAKVKPKLNSKQFIANNPYVQRLLAKDWILEFLDYDAAKESEEMSGYSIKLNEKDAYGRVKNPILAYYDIMLENAILVYDAVVWYNRLDNITLEDKLDAISQILGVYANKANEVIMHYIETGELPKGYTSYELVNKFLDKVLGVNDKIDGAYDKVEDFYEKHEDKITEYIDKAKNFYEEYLDRDYTEIIDLANLSVYADGNAYEVYKILLEMSEENNAFNIDTLATAIFDSTNYHGVNKIEDVMTNIKSKLEGAECASEIQDDLAYVRDAYKATLNEKEVKGYNTGNHTVIGQRYLQYSEYPEY